MFTLEASTQFKKDFKVLSQLDEKRVEIALNILAETGTLPYDPYLTHRLKGEYKDNMEAHLRSDLLIIWYEKVGNAIKLIRVGSHSKIFKK